MTSSFGGGSMALILCYIFYGGHIIHVGKMVTGDLVLLTVLCSAPSVPQPVFTITEKAPTRAFFW